MAEACIAGAVLATSIAITFTIMAQGRTMETYAAHRMAAAHLARTEADALASDPSPTCTATTSGGFVTVGGAYPFFTWSFQRGDADGTASPTGDVAPTSTPAIPAGKLCQATVSIRYNAQKGSIDDNTDGTPNNGIGQLTVTKLWSRK